ncbi:major facilitator superfamily MFS_1 [Paenibacillus curdlanolyticus YK9]|uniref:Major facilitator superfamily MFS_1 n=2 Tax=Paenibacillus curdlanolyticus TaxID=59840 RepID=E0ID37_9BACL|nr:major facilitator superfamily MFS_1 [Paenibacillus curdlanolyticus YK9]
MGIKSKSSNLFRVEGFPSLILINILFGVSFSFVLPFTSLFGIDEVGMSNTSFGVFMTVSSIANVIVSTYIGKISDGNLSRRSLLLICSLAAAVGYATYAFVRDYYVLLIVSSLVLGIASSSLAQMFAYARELLTRSRLPENETPLYMNVFRTFFALSWTIGPALGSFILIKLGFKGLYLFVAAIYLIIIVSVFFFMKKSDDVQEKELRTRASAPSVPLRTIIFQSHILINLIAFTLIKAATTIGSMNMSQFMIKELHSGEEQIGIVFSIPPIFEIPFMLLTGVLATRVDNRILIRLGMLSATLYFTLLYVASHPWEVYLIQILSAATISITSGVAITYFQNFIPDMPGTATSLYMNTSTVGSMVAFLLFGFTAELYGYRFVNLVCALLAVASLVLLLAVRKREARASA